MASETKQQPEHESERRLLGGLIVLNIWLFFAVIIGSSKIGDFFFVPLYKLTGLWPRHLVDWYLILLLLQLFWAVRALSTRGMRILGLKAALGVSGCVALIVFVTLTGEFWEPLFDDIAQAMNAPPPPDIKPKPDMKKEMVRAKDGYASAQTAIGKAYASGDQLPKDAKKARLWLTKAAEQNDMEGAAALGHLLLSSNKAQDRAEALYWAALAERTDPALLDEAKKKGNARRYQNGESAHP